MLKNRVITALVLAPLSIVAILFLPATGFAVFWGSFILVAAWEWSNLAGLVRPLARGAFTAAVGGLLLVIRYTAEYWAPGTLPVWFYGPAVAWWFALSIGFRSAAERLLQARYSVPAKLAAGVFVLVSAWALMVWLRLNFGAYQVLYLVLSIWLADIVAYFVGKRFGHTKLLPSISPGKTVEGAYGAVFAVLLTAIGVGMALGLGTMNTLNLAFLSVITVLFSILGDLFESLMKRIRGVKDSSEMLPGHGGVLDRIDSLLAGVSVFYAGSLAFGIFLQAETVTLPADVGQEGTAPEAIPLDQMPPEEVGEGVDGEADEHPLEEGSEHPGSN